MKNLLTYTGQTKQFSQEDETLIKIQIDNSLDLGWKSEDIILVTDFPFQYNGVKSLVIEDGIYYDFDKNANKVPVIVYLLQHALLETNELYWCHDLDAYELHQIKESELELENVDLGLTHYTYKPEWQCGSIFFKTQASDIFALIDATTRKKQYGSRNNEKTMTHLINTKTINNSRYKKMNATYNLMKKFLTKIYPLAQKPIKVLHFRPSDKDPSLTESTLNMFMYGKNSLRIPLMNKRLIKIFNHHGLK